MKGEVVELVHGDRAIFQMMVNRSSRMYKRENVRLDTTKMYQEDEEEKLNNQQMGTKLEARKDHKLEGFLKVPRKARQVPNTSNAVPRRSSRPENRKVTQRTQGETLKPCPTTWMQWRRREQGDCGTRPSTGRRT